MSCKMRYEPPCLNSSRFAELSSARLEFGRSLYCILLSLFIPLKIFLIFMTASCLVFQDFLSTWTCNSANTDFGTLSVTSISFTVSIFSLTTMLGLADVFTFRLVATFAPFLTCIPSNFFKILQHADYRFLECLLAL